MYPYYILDLTGSNFDTNKKQYITPVQQGNMPNDRFEGKMTKIENPHTTISKSEFQNINGFIRYDIRLENIVNEKIRTFVIDDFINEYIQISNIKAYYSTNHKILIITSNQRNFLTLKRYIKDYNLYLYKDLDIDFDRIERRCRLVGINSAWFGKSTNDTYVSASSIHGIDIQLSTQYRRLREKGVNITNLSFFHEFNDRVYDIMVTKLGGLILYKDIEINEALPLIEDVYQKIII